MTGIAAEVSDMRTIDKDATIEELQRAANANIAEPVGNGVFRYTDDHVGLIHAVSIVEDMPEETVPPVVLCKDCVWRDDIGHWLGCPILNTDDDNFCSYGERKGTDE